MQAGVGAPDAALSLASWPEPQVGPGRVVVALEAAAVHAFDLLAIRGRLPGRPRGSDGVPGSEGVGRVIARGDDVDLPLGARVVFPIGSGTWRDRVLVSAHRLVRVPDTGSAAQLAHAAVAPCTAWRLLEDFVDLQPGEWVLQNAGSGAVALWVARLARQRGLRTLSVVRRAHGGPPLRDAGADIVLGAREPLDESVARYTAGARVRLALDGIAGEATDRLARCLNLEGTVVTYGMASGQPARIEPVHALPRDVRWRGCWLPTRLAEVDHDALVDFVRAAAHTLATGGLALPLAGVFPLDRFQEAVRAAEDPRRYGRIVLTGEAWTV